MGRRIANNMIGKEVKIIQENELNMNVIVNIGLQKLETKVKCVFCSTTLFTSKFDGSKSKMRRKQKNDIKIKVKNVEENAPKCYAILTKITEIRYNQFNDRAGKMSQISEQREEATCQ